MSEQDPSFSLEIPMSVVDRNELNFSWLVRLRWGSIVGQLATIFAVHWIARIELPIVELVAIVGLEAFANLLSVLWLRRRVTIEEYHLAATMALDVALLTGLLYYTGGASNPFSFLYLVQVALATVVVHALWTWGLVALSFLAFGLLLASNQDLPSSARTLHDEGMWVALGVASGFIVYFLLRITRALADRERELAAARRLAAKKDRLAALATLAAGAAHELATPLGTIALVAKELERNHTRESTPADLPRYLEDVRLIREQVQRCRVILDQMAGDAGQSAGESLEDVRIGELIANAMENVREAPAVELRLGEDVMAQTVRVPPRAMSQALRSLITNAQDASPRNRVVHVRANSDQDGIAFEIRDRGQGMSPQTIKRIGEPFYTTKRPGAGMGLGLFLTRAIIEDLGGTLEIESRLGSGTRVALLLPRSVMT